MSVSTVRRLNQIPSRRSINTSLRLALALIVSISYSFIYIEAAGSRECLCENNATCSPNNGICTCTQGWEGQYCNKKRCDHRHYGDECQHRCSCFNGASCHPVTGECLCSAGYRGVNCNTTCPEGTYGFKCTKDCTCPINTVCSPIDGSCTFKYKFEYNGTHCECRPKNSIPGCEACNCSQLGTCDLTTGECMCQVGYTGESCRKLHCGDKHYVPGCHGNCNCQYNATCYERDWSCDCLPGWTGKSCNDSCPDGRYGINCQSKCTCENSTSCDPQTGRCGDLLTTYTEESKRAPRFAVLLVIAVILTITVCPAFYIIMIFTPLSSGDTIPMQNFEERTALESPSRSDDFQEHSTEQITENRTAERSRGARES
ncbi:multiple epidermal growth factor-like domains protein 10 isoform X2 [Actinia tenebrosa]|uniref:Multiple epidermal growth factor-like domains protein 10 isoform X2 n=1 Tax=Actinia tenebrosa TaxID=6105 RepID=A0A6P8I1Z5_ACTTE|nr:multiple epidermal growth factor-like domains protein 10 isoform X2 [Actinia tenebrosa]